MPRETDSDLAISFTQRKSRARGDALLLVGPPDSGKTAILLNVSRCMSFKIGHS